MLIETKNLKTRTAAEIDIEFLSEIQTNQLVKKYTGGVLDTYENTVAHIKKNPRLLDIFNIIELKETSALIGIFAFLPNQHLSQEELLISLLPDYWGKGYGSELLSEVKEHWLTTKGMYQMYATVAPENKASIKMPEKEGFTLVEEYTEPFRQKQYIYKYEKTRT